MDNMLNMNSHESVKRVHKQHSSLVVTLPAEMCRMVGVARGDYVVFQWSGGERSVVAVFGAIKKGVEDGSRRVGPEQDSSR